ncbi:MAG TPA: hypothetical protein VGD43_23605, partial [Micromonospora sp.]
RQIIPRQVPPLIAQHRPDLRPTGRNKMWNARLEEKASPGRPMEPVAYAQDAEAIRRNTGLWLPILDAATDVRQFKVPGAGTTYRARIAVVDHAELLKVLNNLTWLEKGTLKPELAWLGKLAPEQLARWVVMIPFQTRGSTLRSISGRGPFSIFERDRPNGRSFRVFSESRHRNAAYRIAGIDFKPECPDGVADGYNDGRTGAVILYPVVEKGSAALDNADWVDPSAVTMAMHIVTPKNSAPAGGRLIKWRTVDGTNPSAVVVDRQPGS